MGYKVQEKKIVVSGNELLMTQPTRREANEFREAMKAADGDGDAQAKVGFDFIARHVRMADGSALDLDDVPVQDSIEMLKLLMGTGAAGVSDFTPRP